MPNEPGDAPASTGPATEGFDGDLGVDTAADGGAPTSTPEGATAPAGATGGTGKLEPIRDFKVPAQFQEEPAQTSAPAPAGPVEVEMFDPTTGALVKKPVDYFVNTYKSEVNRWRATQAQLAQAKQINDRWREWYEYQQTHGGGGARPATDQKPEVPKNLLEAVDWESVEQTAQKEGFKAALQEAFLDVEKHLNHRFDTTVRPLEEARTQDVQARAFEGHAADFAMSQVMAVGEDGMPVYPELFEGGTEFDPQAAQAVLAHWREILLSNPGFGVTPLGFRAAVNAYRVEALMQRSSQGTPAQTVTDAASGGALNAQAARVAAGQVARDRQGRIQKQDVARNEVSASLGSGVTPVESRPAADMQEAAVKRGIREAGKVNKFLGVYPD